MAASMTQSPDPSSLLAERHHAGSDGQAKDRSLAFEDSEPAEPQKRGGSVSICATSMKAQKYDIPTLLKIGQRLGQKDSSKRLNLGHFFGSGRRSVGSGSYVLRERSVNHTRTSTNMSMETEASYHTSQSTNIQFPVRQPLNAPEGNIAQTNEGFARFLKEHASPRHHRVTAGGRIVPMSVHVGPTPEFRLPAKNSESEDGTNPTKPMRESEPNANNVSQRRRRVTRATTENGAYNKAEASRRRESIISQSNKGVNTAGSTQYQTPMMAVPAVAGPMTPGQIGSMNYTPLLGSLGMDGISMSQNQMDQTGFPFPNLQQCYSQAVIPQLAAQQAQGGSQNFLNTGCNIGLYGTPSAMGMMTPAQIYQLPNAFNTFVGPMASGSNLGQSVGTATDTRGLENMLESAIQDFETVSTHLSNLDRYMAVHTWDIDPASKKILVIQRMELVTKLDAARVLKENLETILRSSNEQSATAKPQSRFPNAGAPDYVAAAPCTPNASVQGGYRAVGPPDTGGSSFSVSDAHGFMSPVQLSGTPYLSPEQYCENGYLNLPPNGTPNNWTTPGFDAVGGIFDRLADDDDDDMRIITTPNGQTVIESNNKWVPPPELSHIYQKIELAARLNEPLGPLFEELAKVTAHMTRLGINKGHKSEGPLSPFGYFGKPGIEVPRGRGSARLEIVDPKDRQGVANKKVQTPIPSKNPVTVDPPKEHNTPQKKTSIVQQSPLSFTPCRQHCRKRESRKVETLAIEQKVNVHGYLPPFDGSGDETRNQSPERARQEESNHNPADKADATKPAAGTQSTWMDFLRSWPDPNPMDVRRFFKFVRDEDKATLDKYRKERERRAFG